MTQPSLTALLQQFQKLNPDAPFVDLLEQLVGIVEQLRATPAAKRKAFPFVIRDEAGAFVFDPAVYFNEPEPDAGIALYSKARPVPIEGRGYLIGWLTMPEAVMMAHALAEAIAHAGKVRPYKAEAASPDGEDIPY
jgi:hypothetical protein